MADKQRFKKQPTISQIAPIKHETIRRLIADLIGDKDRTGEQNGFRLESEMLPENMMFEKAALNTVYMLTKNNIAPSKQNVLDRLSPAFEDASHLLNQLLLFQTYGQPMVGLYAWQLGEWISRKGMEVAAKGFVDQLTNASMLSSDDLYQDFMANVQQYAPRVTQIETIGIVESQQNWLEHQKAMRKRVLEGGTMGPQLPWTEVNKMMGGYIHQGDMVHITAKTKTGKTLLGQIIGEHIAHGLSGYDVDLYHCETEAKDIERRRMCRELMISADDIDMVDFDQPDIKGLYDATLDYTRQAEINRGRFTYRFCPSIGIEELGAEIARRAAESAGRGREYVWILDYYTCVIAPKGMSDAQANNYLANRLKAITQGTRTYSVIFSQYPIDADWNARSASFNGSEIGMKAQANFQWQRERNEQGTSRPVVINGVPMLDSLGKPAYYHRSEHEMGSAARMRMVSGNHGYPGVVQLDVMGEYFKVVEKGKVSTASAPF